jgi:hypothetical protein
MKKNLMNFIMAMVVAAFLSVPTTALSGPVYDDFLKDTKYTAADGQKVSMTSYNDAGVKSTYSGVAVNFSTHVVENNLMVTTSAVNDGDWFTAFCVDPFQSAQIGGTLGVNLVSPSKVNGGLQAAWLFENYYEKNPTTVAALQVAIWEVIVDYDHAYNLKSGDYFITSLNGKSLTDTNVTWTLANNMLADLQKNYSADDLDYMYRISQTSTKQDFIMRLYDAPVGSAEGAGTPEPATVILMGIGVLGLAGFRKFRKN